MQLFLVASVIYFCLSQLLTSEILAGNPDTGYAWLPGPDLPANIVPICAEQVDEAGTETFIIAHKTGGQQRNADSWTYDWTDVSYLLKKPTFTHICDN